VAAPLVEAFILDAFFIGFQKSHFSIKKLPRVKQDMFG
jgi:hypothetical protein